MRTPKSKHSNNMWYQYFTLALSRTSANMLRFSVLITLRFYAKILSKTSLSSLKLQPSYIQIPWFLNCEHQRHEPSTIFGYMLCDWKLICIVLLFFLYSGSKLLNAVLKIFRSFFSHLPSFLTGIYTSTINNTEQCMVKIPLKNTSSFNESIKKSKNCFLYIK